MNAKEEFWILKPQGKTEWIKWKDTDNVIREVMWERERTIWEKQKGAPS